MNSCIKNLTDNYPNINNLIYIEKESIKEIYRICKMNKYDLAVVVRPLFSTALALFISGVKYRLGTGYRWYSFLFNLRHYEHRKHSIKHELEYNIGLLERIGIKNEVAANPVLYISDEDIKNIKEKLSVRGIDFRKPIIIIHPVLKGSALVWDYNNFTDLLNLLLDNKELFYQVLLTGKKEEELLLKTAAGELINQKNLFIVTDLNLREFASLVKVSEVMVCNSSGPIHIAAAVGTFCVGFYSPHKTESQLRWGPRTDKKIIFTLSEADKKIPHPKQVSEFILNLIRKNHV